MKTNWRMPAVLLLFFLVFLVYGCEENRDYVNPLDPKNLRTSGSPPGLVALAGDGAITVSWRGPDLQGMEGGKYKIYRRFEGDLNADFEMVGEVDVEINRITGREIERYQFVDKGPEGKGLQNDPPVNPKTDEPLRYIYRVAYVDRDGVEVPDAKILLEQKEPRQVWPEIKATPSVPPPPPRVVLGSPKDLRVELFWTDYTPPQDIAGYRIYINNQLVETLEYLKLKGPEEQFFIDTDFQRDMTEKKYRIVAFDKFGVESPSEPITAASPNLPPSLPRYQVDHRLDIFNPGKYDVFISWTPSKETDVRGYFIYQSLPDGTWDTKPRSIELPKENRRIDYRNERAMEVGGQLLCRDFYVAAVDNTPKEGGSPDVSLPPAKPRVLQCGGP